MSVTILKNAEGYIGGYVVTPPIADSPVSYLNADGNFLTSFHIFASDEEKKTASLIIEKLRKSYPKEEPFICPK
jgi:hypothetical protein